MRRAAPDPVRRRGLGDLPGDLASRLRAVGGAQGGAQPVAERPGKEPAASGSGSAVVRARFLVRIITTKDDFSSEQILAADHRRVYLKISSLVTQAFRFNFGRPASGDAGFDVGTFLAPSAPLNYWESGVVCPIDSLYIFHNFLGGDITIIEGIEV